MFGVNIKSRLLILEDLRFRAKLWWYRRVSPCAATKFYSFIVTLVLHIVIVSDYQWAGRYCTDFLSFTDILILILVPATYSIFSHHAIPAFSYWDSFSDFVFDNLACFQDCRSSICRMCLMEQEGNICWNGFYLVELHTYLSYILRRKELFHQPPRRLWLTVSILKCLLGL